MQAYDLHLLGIPGSRRTIASSDPYHEQGSTVYPFLSEREELADPFSVARVRPRTSKGITDLLLLNLVRLIIASPSKKKFNPIERLNLFSRTESRSLSELTRLNPAIYKILAP